MVTEVGRQPWIIYQIMRTSEAVTPVPNQFVAFGGFTIIYVILAARLSGSSFAWAPAAAGAGAPAGPRCPHPSTRSDEDTRHALA